MPDIDVPKELHLLFCHLLFTDVHTRSNASCGRAGNSATIESPAQTSPAQ
jgi:hypothetical protein